MAQRIDRTGQRRGKLTVLQLLRPGTTKQPPVWLCRCDCGVVKEINGNYLKDHPNVKGYSCGCGRFYGGGGPEQGAIKSAFAGFKNKAAARKLEQKLTYAEWYNLSQLPCYFCGEEKSNTHKSFAVGGIDFRYNGIDRLDSEKGYTHDNCVPCCSTCNMAKRKLTEVEFLAWVKRVYLHNAVNSQVSYTGI